MWVSLGTNAVISFQPYKGYYPYYYATEESWTNDYDEKDIQNSNISNQLNCSTAFDNTASCGSEHNASKYPQISCHDCHTAEWQALIEKLHNLLHTATNNSDIRQLENFNDYELAQVLSDYIENKLSIGRLQEDNKKPMVTCDVFADKCTISEDVKETTIAPELQRTSLQNVLLSSKNVDEIGGFLIRLGAGLRRLDYKKRSTLEIKFLTLLQESEMYNSF